jgi:hypothetical protein
MPADVVGWSRGEGCAEVAAVLSDVEPVRIEGDLRRSCVDARIDLLVARKFSSFDLVPVVVPNAMAIDSIGSVTAAVGEGPHSPFAVEIAARVGRRLGIPTEVATVYRDDEDRERAELRLFHLAAPYPDVERRSVLGSSAVDLLEPLSPTALIVVGAPGGSWFYRQIYGPGHRLTVAAPAGALLVRSAPRRAFHEARDVSDAIVGVHLSARDALRIVGHAVAAVAEDGHLVGIVRTAALEDADPGAPVGDLMEPPVAVDVEEPMASVDELRDFLEGGPVPVVDGGGRLVGLVPGGASGS